MREKLHHLTGKLRNEYCRRRLQTCLTETTIIHEKLGTERRYGVIPVNFLHSQAICYSADSGEDICFELGLIKKFKCRVYIFNPAPQAKKFYDGIVTRAGNTDVNPVNYCSPSEHYLITPEELKLCFFNPFSICPGCQPSKSLLQGTKATSHSVLHHQKNDEYLEPECRKLTEIMSLSGHQKITLLKMDIASAEHHVLDSMITDKIYPEILVIGCYDGTSASPVHRPDDKYFKRITQVIHKLKSAGYILTCVDTWNATFIHASKIPSSEKVTMVMLLKRILAPIIILIMSVTALCTSTIPSDSANPAVPSPISHDNQQSVLNSSIAPPAQPVKLIFIHHSCGRNWLEDGNGGLGLALRDHNYFVSDISYGWGPAPLEGSEPIGSLTDIGQWWLWFRGPESAEIMDAVYAESSQTASYSRLTSNPGGKNTIVMFKSCYPNSNLRGNPYDPVPMIDPNPLKGIPSSSDYHTVANAKGIYNDLLPYFQQHQETLFVIVTAPPVSNTRYAGNARAFNQWLVDEWLKDYPHKNVVVFDLYNVLTTNAGSTKLNDLGRETGNHHRWWNNTVQHLVEKGVSHNTTAYASSRGDDHPSRAGNLKATAEFVPLLNFAYNQWQAEVRDISPSPGTR